MQIYDRIRKQLEQPDGLTFEALQPLALEYRQEVRKANARLTECVQLLRKGLRSEAIQQAFMKPNVLDWAAKLDFPEFDEWLEILKFYSIDLPDIVDRDAAMQLHEALVEEQPLEELLKQHRRLAIAKAPLAWRLKVLRRLGELDPLNSVWKEDQEQWETVRLKQLPIELKTARDSNDVDLALQIFAELESSSWSVAPPQDLKTRAQKLANELKDAALLAELEKVLGKLHVAYGEGDEESGRQLRAEWISKSSMLSGQLPYELSIEAAPALEWLEQLKRERETRLLHSRNIESLELLLGRKGTKLLELQNAYYQLASTNVDIEPLLEKQYQTRVREIETTSRRRLVLATCSICFALMGSCFGGMYWYQRNAYKEALNTVEVRLSELLGSGDFDEAEQLYNSVKGKSPTLAASPEIQSLFALLQVSMQKEKERRENILAMIESIDTDDSSLDIDRILVAEKGAIREDEKKLVLDLRNRWEKRERAIADGQFNVVKESLVAFESRLSELQTLAPDEKVEEEISSIVADSQRLLIENPRCGPQAHTLVGLTVQKGNSLIASVRKQRRDTAARQALLSGMRNAKSLIDLEAQMRIYTQELAEDALAPVLKKTLAESKLWSGPEEWTKWCADLSSSATASTIEDNDLELFATRLDDIEKKLAPVPVSPVETYLRKAKGLKTIREKVLTELDEELRDSVMLDLVTLLSLQNPADSTAGTRHFINTRARDEFAGLLSKDKSHKSLFIPVVSDNFGSVSNKELRGKLITLDEPRRLFRKLNQRLSMSRNDILEKWDTELQSLVAAVLAETQLDGLIKTMLIARLVSAASSGSDMIRDAYADFSSSVFETEESRATWFLERQFETDMDEELRRKLEQAAAKWKKQLADRNQAFSAINKRKLVWVGCFLPNASGLIEARMYRNDVPDGELITILPDSSMPERGRIELVGKVESKKASIIERNPSLQAGRPLFWRTTIAGK